MALLITGGTGFLGAYLTRHAVAEGEEVVLFDRYPSRRRIADVADRVTVVEGDVLEPQELLAAMARHDVDRVAHFAAIPGPPLPEKIVPYLRVQCVGTANVFETARLHGVRRVVNASSVAVFGHRPSIPGVASEEDPARPDDPYGTCKLWSESIAGHYNDTHGMEILSLRVCSSLGLGRVDRASLASGVMGIRTNFMAAPELAARGEPVTMPPDGQVSDFLYAADTAQAFWLALTRPRPEHAVFNLRAEQRPVGDFTRLLRGHFPNAEIAVADGSTGGLQLMDNTRLVRELGFEPGYTLETGLADYVERIRALGPLA